MFDPAFPNSVTSDNTCRCVAMVVPQRDGDLPAYRCVRVGVREIDGKLVCAGHGGAAGGDPVLRRAGQLRQRQRPPQSPARHAIARPMGPIDGDHLSKSSRNLLRDRELLCSAGPNS
jgi:hypothetical protein